MDEKQLQLLWDLHAKNGGFKSFDEFKGLMANDNARKTYFDNANKELGFKDFNDFENTVKKKDNTFSFSLPGTIDISQPTQNGSEKLLTAPPSQVFPNGLTEEQDKQKSLAELNSSGITINPTPEQDKAFQEAINTPQKSFEQVGIDYEKQKKAEQGAKDYITGVENKENDPFITFGKSIWNTLAYQLPSAIVGALAASSKSSPDHPSAEAMFPDFSKPLGTLGHRTQEQITNESKKNMIDWAIKHGAKGEEMTKDLVGTMDKIKDPIDALNWFSYAMGQAAGQIPASVATGGATSIGQEVGSIYLDGIKKIAQDHNLSVQQVIDQKLDHPAVAIAFGTASGLLDYIGAKTVLKVPKQSLISSLRKRATDLIKTGGTEAGTEYSQTWIEQIGKGQVAGNDLGKSWEEANTNEAARERLESAAQGFVGGAGAHMIGNKISPNEKPIEQSGEVPGQNVPEVKQEESVPVQTPQEEQKTETIKPKENEITNNPTETTAGQRPEVSTGLGENTTEGGTEQKVSGRDNGKSGNEKIRTDKVLETESSPEVEGKKIEPHKEVKASKAEAIKEVAPKFKLKEMEAGMLHNLKDKEIVKSDYFNSRDNPEGLKGQIFKKLEDAGYVEQLSSEEKLLLKTDSDYILTDKAKEFIDAVDSRYQTRKQVKSGSDLFPEHSNIKELKQKENAIQKRKSETLPLDETSRHSEEVGTRIPESGKVAQENRTEEEKQPSQVGVNPEEKITQNENPKTTDQGSEVLHPESNKEVKADAIKEANDIAKEHGFDSASHLLNSVQKRVGKEYATVQEIPKKIIDQVKEERNAEPKKGDIVDFIAPSGSSKTGTIEGFNEDKGKYKIRATNGTVWNVDPKSIGTQDYASAKGKKTITSPDEGKPRQNKSSKPFNMADRVKQIFAEFKIPINEKSLRSTYNGVFKYFTEGVRVQSMWDIHVAAHEALHAFDNRFGLFEKIQNNGSQKLKNELLDAYDNLYPAPKKTADLKERIKEGMAMVTQYYLADPVMTEQRFPDSVKSILQEKGQFYQDEVGQFLSKMQDLSDEYFSLRPQDKINARIKWTANDSKSGLGFWAKVQTQLANDLTPAAIVDNMLGGTYRANAITPNVAMLRLIGSVASNWVKHPFGTASKPQTYLGNGQWGATKSGFRVFDYLKNFKDANKLIEFNNLLVARRQHEDYLKLESLEKEIEKLTKSDPTFELLKSKIEEHTKLNDILSNNKIPLDIAQGTVKALEEKYTKEIKIFDSINADLIDFMENTEYISKEKADEYRKGKGYTSFQRVIEDEHLNNIDGLNLSRSSKSSVKALKERTGSALQLVPPTYSQILAINEILTKGQRNLVWKAWADAAKSNKEIAQIFEQVTQLDVDVNSKEIQEVKENGVSKYYKIGEEVKLFGEALTPIQVEAVSEVFRAGARMFQIGTTGAYPIFGLINLTMDAWTRLAQTKTGLMPVISDVPTVGKAFKGLIGWMRKVSEDNEFSDFMALGGRRSTYQAQQLVDAEASIGEMLNKGWWQKTKKGGEIGLQILELPTNFSELIGRGTEFVRAQEKGYPTNVAMLMAAEVSVNFSNKGKFGGKTGQEMVKWVSYMGASIQALDQSIKTLKNDPKRIGSVIAFATVITSMGALLTYMLGDDDEKDMLADQVAEDYARWLYVPNSVFGGKPGLTRFRMPEQVGIFAGFAQLYFSHLFREKPLVFKEFYQVLETPLPSQAHFSQGSAVLLSYIPTAVSPEIQTLANVRFYPEVLPIVPKYLEDYAAWRQYTKYSSRAAKAIGEITAGNFNVSPVKADFYMRAKFGRAFQLVESLAESAIYGDEVRSYIPMWQEYDRIMSTGRMYNKFWDIVEEAKATAKALDPKNTPNASIERFVEAKIRSELLNVDAKILRLNMDQINGGKELKKEEKRKLYDMILRDVKDDYEHTNPIK